MKEKKVIVKKNRCPQNHPCPAVRYCPVDALKQVGFKAPTISDACISCGKCIKVCPMGALAYQ